MGEMLYLYMSAHACAIALGSHTHDYMHASMLWTHTHTWLYACVSACGAFTCMRHCMWHFYMHGPMHASKPLAPPIHWKLYAPVQLMHIS